MSATRSLHLFKQQQICMRASATVVPEYLAQAFRRTANSRGGAIVSFLGSVSGAVSPTSIASMTGVAARTRGIVGGRNDTYGT
jgi:hypothetical protein